MLIYYILFFSIVIGAFCELANIRTNQRLIIFFINFTFLYFIAAFRYESGIDYFLYKEIFDYAIPLWKIDSLDFFTINNVRSIESGYLLFQSVFKIFSNDFKLFLIFYDSILFLFVLKGISYCFKYANVQLLVIVSIFFLYYILGMQRQAMAVAIFFSSIRYIITRDFYKYLLFVLIGLLFHSVMFLALISYFIVNINLKRKTILILLIVSFLFMYFNIAGILIEFLYNTFTSQQIIRRIYYYWNVLEDKGEASLFSYLHRLFLCMVVFYYYNIIDKRISNLLIISLLSYFILSDMGMLAGRISGFYLLAYALYFSILCASLSNNFVKFIVVSYWVVYGGLSITKTIYMSENHLGELYYIPYKSVFLTF